MLGIYNVNFKDFSLVCMINLAIMSLILARFISTTHVTPCSWEDFITKNTYKVVYLKMEFGIEFMIFRLPTRAVAREFCL